MTKDYEQLWEGVTRITDEAQAVQALAGILADKEGRAFVTRLGGKDAELCIEILDDGIIGTGLKPAEKQVFFVTLRRLSGSLGQLPDSLIIRNGIEVSGETLASSVFADLSSGTYNGYPVAVKAMRVTAQDDFSKIRKRFCKEVVLWNTLSHPNVMELFGVYGDMGKGKFVTVSEWMSHGNIMEYIKNKNVNKLELLYGVAKGLKYLHGARIAHGDLKGSNILMSNDTPPRACLADFGFMTMIFDPVQPMACSAQLEGGAMTFMSPELLVPQEFGKERAVPTPQADIYAFGLVIFQVLTGEIPFRGVPQSALGHSVVHGKRPEKPENASAIGFSDSLWYFAQRCWDGRIELRPQVGEVVTRLRGAAASWDGSMPLLLSVAPGSGGMLDPGNHGGVSQPLSSAPPSPIEISHEIVTNSLKGPHDDLQAGEIYPHLNKHCDPPPSQLPRRERNNLGYYVAKFFGQSGHGR